jgi:hypothetical protein
MLTAVVPVSAMELPVVSRMSGAASRMSRMRRPVRSLSGPDSGQDDGDALCRVAGGLGRAAGPP